MKYVVRVILVLCLIKKIQGDLDTNVCNPLVLKPVPPPPPALPLSYSTKLEWKWVDKNQTISVTEVHDGINNIGSQTIYMLGQTTQIIYDYDEHQYIVYDPIKGCTVTGLGTIEFYDNKIWLAATKMIYQLAREGTAPHIGQTVVRNVTVGHWKACLFFFQSNITLEIDMYFSVTGWGMAISAPNQMVPVRFEMKGSYDYRNNSSTPATYFHVIGDFVDFRPKPPTNLDPLQPPPGVFCRGRKSRKPMNPIPSSFSLTMEKIDMDYFTISYQSVWFHAVKKLVRRDAKDARGSDPDPTVDILDYNLGIHYSLDTYASSCNPTEITVQDLYAKPHGDNTLVMQSALDFFHVQNANIQYVGTRTARGVACDVWVGQFTDAANANDIVEWYFTKDNWVEAVDLAIQPAALIRMDIWKDGSNKPVIHNVYHFDPEAPSLDVFSVTPCYPAGKKRRILIPFKALNGTRIDQVSTSYLKDVLHDVITNGTFIDPLRLADMQIEFQGSDRVYMAATLLDRPVRTSRYLFPQPAPASMLHDLEETYFFLNGFVNQPLTLKINSTVSTEPVTIQATGLFNIDYPLDASSTTSTTTMSTTEATPPPPTLAPTTTSQKIPTPGKQQLKTSTAPTTPSTTLSSTSTSVSTTSTTLSTQSPCVCPTVTCPKVRKPTSPPPVTCPTLPPTTPCPSSTKPTPTTTTSQTTTPTPTATTQKTKLTTPKTTATTQKTTSTTPKTIPTTPKTTPTTPKPSATTITSSTPAVTSPTPDKTLSYSTAKTPAALKIISTRRTVGSQSTLFLTKSSSTTPDNCSNLVKQLRQTNTKEASAKGLSGGVVAAIAIVMLLVGLVCGIIALRFYQVLRRNRDSEGRNILSRYLDDDLKY